jgi:aspartokinase/homoserine dehydrogenase 1
MKVMKFGGSSVADAGRMRTAAGLVREAARSGRVVVVLSAMQGITDLLIAAARSAESGSDDFRAALDTLRNRHLEAVRGLLAPVDQAAVITPLTLMANELEEVLHGVELLRECTHRTMDLAMSFGERMSCTIFTAFLAAQGEHAVYVDARELIVTDERFGSGVVDFAASYPRIASRLGSEPGIPVVTGFIAATPKGVTTTIGRNGSDYTASILGAGLGAETIEIWTDVDGVLSADPRVVPDAFVIPQVSFEEAMELSYFGAKVIHPSTMIPAVEGHIPILIKNTLNPSAPGTLIGDGGKRADHPITGIASIEGISLLNIEGGGMIGIPGIAARIFSALAREGVNIIMISQASSEHTISLVFKAGEADRALGALRGELALELETGRLEELELARDLVVISVIGENMRGTPGIAGRIFSALGAAGVNVLVIAQGSSERNISFVVAGGQHVAAVRTIHNAFLGQGRPEVGTDRDVQVPTLGHGGPTPGRPRGEPR